MYGEDTIAVIAVTAVAIIILAYFVYRILQNPFKYPYFSHSFDVSRKRNVHIEDYIDQYLCDNRNWLAIQMHMQQIEQWKHDTEACFATCRFRKRRARQYREILDDDHAFQFVTVRGQTRYTQRNYVKQAYRVKVTDSVCSVSWTWLVNRHERLSEIGFEATLRDYHSKDQRRLMTKALRKQIMERDNYTCQICGKYMPDEVGLQIDHIIPVAKGGKTICSNLQVLCSKCNGRKQAK